MPQDPAYHRFADARTLLGVPRALDTLSSLAFAVLGGYGLIRMGARRLPTFARASSLSFHPHCAVGVDTRRCL